MTITILEKIEETKKRGEFVTECTIVYDVCVTNDAGQEKHIEVYRYLNGYDADDFVGSFEKFNHTYEYNTVDGFDNAGWAYKPLKSAVWDAEDELGIEE